MFNRNEIKLLTDHYFKVIRTTEEYYEVQSKNTKHCWIIRKCGASNIIIHHKHFLKEAYYHKHGTAISIKIAVSIIKKHDELLVESRNRKLQ